MDLNTCIQLINDYIWSWPSIICVVVVAAICTLAFRFIQIRTFFQMWKETFAPSDQTKHTGDISPIQAFVNTLSASIGNGSLAGVAVAIYAGGPGAALWVIILGFLLMAVRFAEVYLSIAFGSKQKGAALGGPMVYLKEVIGGRYLAYVYGLSTFIFGLIGGNAAQANSIRLSFETTWAIPAIASAIGLTLFVAYVVMGGATRIAKVSDMVVPVKVLVFFGSTGIILAVYASQIMGALQLIISSGLSSQALAGGALGFSMQQAMRSGILGATFATESGLGTSAILFGGSGGTQPYKSGLMAMLSTFISTVVCFVVALCIVVTGVASSGLSSTALTIASFEPVFGSFGGPIVSFLSVVFGVGVLVAYAYITRAAWMYLTNGNHQGAFVIMYCLATFLGALVKVDIVWNSINIVMAVMLFINMFGIVYLIPRIVRDLNGNR